MSASLSIGGERGPGLGSRDTESWKWRVGTGKNASYYPRGVQVTAVDLSDKMLEWARRRVQRLAVEVDLSLMDAQRLAFPDVTFDAAVATFIFCKAGLEIE